MERYKILRIERETRKKEKEEGVISRLSRDIARAGRILNVIRSNDVLHPRALSSYNEFWNGFQIPTPAIVISMVVSRDRVDRNSKEKNSASKRDDHCASDSWAHDNVFLGARVVKMKREKAVSSFATRSECRSQRTHRIKKTLFWYHES